MRSLRRRARYLPSSAWTRAKASAARGTLSAYCENSPRRTKNTRAVVRVPRTLLDDQIADRTSRGGAIHRVDLSPFATSLRGAVAAVEQERHEALDDHR